MAIKKKLIEVALNVNAKTGRSLPSLRKSTFNVWTGLCPAMTAKKPWQLQDFVRTLAFTDVKIKLSLTARK
jgi:hypothetical protein